ncbi:carbohydrate-binding module family 13 protein [Tulasnella calospora MUT 4182]|uniref:Carbohydrate-binding module family 13 protein n=1 Tax=Tulasnella calospora MUT 4182 TaxID=1051891 RepID=A0A0C3LNP8_9AGAM|nr:carbohydrate-binding module family 13 protein [Tulasnella calospora MUT 4182]
MASGNDDPPSKVGSEEAEGQPPGYEGSDEQASHFREGLYILTNQKSRSTLDMCEGNFAPGTRVIGYEQHLDCDNANQLWVIKQDGLNDTYTLRNFLTGTYMNLLGGDSENASQVVGWPRELKGEGRAKQEWRIKEREHHYTLQCSRADTFLEIPGGDPSNCVDAKCSEASEERDHQLWILELASRTGAEIKALFRSWKPDLFLFQPYGESAQYFVLRKETRRNLWQAAKLLRQPVRSHFFDYDDFVIRMKEAATRWVTDRYKADVSFVAPFPVSRSNARQIRGYSVLFGIIYGEDRKGSRAYNWYLSPDMRSLVFFDAQIGKEYGPATLDEFGFQPTLAIF